MKNCKICKVGPIALEHKRCLPEGTEKELFPDKIAGKSAYINFPSDMFTCQWTVGLTV